MLLCLDMMVNRFPHYIYIYIVFESHKDLRAFMPTTTLPQQPKRFIRIFWLPSWCLSMSSVVYLEVSVQKLCCSSNAIGLQNLASSV